MYLRRKLLTDIKGKPMLQKALSFCLYLKHCVGHSSMVLNCSINKLHTITKVSATTIKKLMPIIEAQGWVSYHDKNKRHLCISNLSSKHKERNICVDKFSFRAYKLTYKSLRAFLALMIQVQKDYIKRLLLTKANPRNGKEYRAAKKKVKRLVKRGILDSMYQTYKECGISYKRFAEQIGCCVRTAIGVIGYAIRKKWAKKEKHSQQFYAPLVCKHKIEDFTFSMKNNLYIVSANTYTLSPSIKRSLGVVLN